MGSRIGKFAVLLTFSCALAWVAAQASAPPPGCPPVQGAADAASPFDDEAPEEATPDAPGLDEGDEEWRRGEPGKSSTPVEADDGEELQA